MTIFICCSGEHSEGTSPYATYNSFIKAKTRILADAKDWAKNLEQKMIVESPITIRVGCDIFTIIKLSLNT